MRNCKPVLLSTTTLFLVVTVACGAAVTPTHVDEVTPTSESVLPTDAPASPTPTLQVILGSPFRGVFPSDVEITPDGTRAYVPCYGSTNVLVIDTSSNEIVDAIDLSGAGPFGFSAIDAAMTPDGERLYLADNTTGKIGVVDTSTNQAIAFVDVEEWWATGGRNHRLEITPDGRFVYAAVESNQVPVIDVTTNSVVEVIALEDSVYLVAFSPDSSRAYLVSQPAGGRIYIVDTLTHTVIDHIDLGFEQELQTQGSIAVSPDGRELYLTSGFNEGGYEHPEIGINRVFVIDVTSRSLVGEIEVIGGPHRILLSPDGRLAYVSTADAEAVYVLDLANRANIGQFDWDGLYAEAQFRAKRYDLRGMGFLSDGRSAYLASWDGDSIIVLDLLERRAAGTIELNPMVGAAPAAVIISPNGSSAYVPTSGELVQGANSGILVIDIASNTIERSIATSVPRRIDMTPDGNTLYVATDPVLVMDSATGNVVADIFLGKNMTVHDVVYVAGQSKLYVSYGLTHIRGGIVAIDLSSNTIERDIDVGWNPVTMVLTPDGTRLYVNRVSNPHDVGELVVIDTATDRVVETIASPIDTWEEIGPIGDWTSGLAISPDGAYVYWTAGWQYINVVEVASNTIVRTIEVGQAMPGRHIAISSIAFLSDGSRAFIVCYDAGYVVVMETETWEFIDVVRVGLRPDGIALTPDDKLAYVTNQYSEDVSVIDLGTNKVIYTIPLGPPQ